MMAPIRMLDVVPYTMQGTFIVIRCRFKGQEGYTDFPGNDIRKMPMELQESLFLEFISTQMAKIDDKIQPIIIYHCSDFVVLMDIKKSMDNIQNLIDRNNERKEDDNNVSE